MGGEKRTSQMTRRFAHIDRETAGAIDFDAALEASLETGDAEPLLQAAALVLGSSVLPPTAYSTLPPSLFSAFEAERLSSPACYSNRRWGWRLLSVQDVWCRFAYWLLTTMRLFARDCARFWLHGQDGKWSAKPWMARMRYAKPFI